MLVLRLGNKPRISPDPESKPTIPRHCKIIRGSTSFLGNFPLTRKAHSKPQSTGLIQKPARTETRRAKKKRTPSPLKT